MSDPDLNHARGALAHLEHLVVQDIFLTETCSYADVILPASRLAREGRHRHQHQPPGADGPRGAAAAGRGAAGSVDHPGSRAAHRLQLELPARRAKCSPRWRTLMPALDNITWERVEREDHVTYPVDGPDVPGRDVVFDKGFPRPSGLAQAGRHQIHRARRDAGRRVSVHPHDRPPARALAHRRDDAARDRARCARAERGRAALARHDRQARHRAGRHGARRDAPRRGGARRASGRRRCRTAWCSSRSPTSRRPRTC